MIHKRSHARDVALQLLFQRDLNPDANRDEIVRFTRLQVPEPELQSFALSLYDGTVEQLADIDARLAVAAENWRLARMAVIDRNILRLGAHELSRPDSPVNVVLNEAIELARKYGSADSPGFVNGVLDRLNRDIVTRANLATEAEPAPSEEVKPLEEPSRPDQAVDEAGMDVVKEAESRPEAPADRP